MSVKVVKKNKKNVARNQKIYWRKHCDIKDVEDFLNEKRLEERIGGPYKHKKDEDLFYIDTNTNEYALKLRNSKETKKQRALLPPRCLELLNPLTAVPDPIVKRNRVKSKEERKSSIRKAIEERKRQNGFIPLKVIEATLSRAITTRKKKLTPKCHEFKKDLWDCENVDEKESTDEMAWLNEQTQRHHLTSSGAFKVMIPSGVNKKKSVVPAVETPHPGSSYNPSLKDHQDLLAVIVERELEKQKEEAHIKRTTSDFFRKVTRSEQTSNWLEEMSQGLPQPGEVKMENCVKDENEDKNDYKAINPPVSFLKKKTKQQRRKQKVEKEDAFKRKTAKIEKKKVADLYKLRFINNDLKVTENNHLKNLENRKKLAAFNVSRTKRLGGKKYEEQDIPFSRACELKGNLRSLKSEGNVLVERFYSMQKRNMLVPTTKRIGGKKAKLKSFFKNSHKLENIDKL